MLEGPEVDRGMFEAEVFPVSFGFGFLAFGTF